MKNSADLLLQSTQILELKIAELVTLFPNVGNKFAWLEAIQMTKERPSKCVEDAALAQYWVALAKEGKLDVKMINGIGLLVGYRA